MKAVFYCIFILAFFQSCTGSSHSKGLTINSEKINAAISGKKQIDQDGDHFDVKIKNIGKLNLPSGKIVAADPTGIRIEALPFKQSVPIGNYEVFLAIGKRENGDEQIGLAWLAISETNTVRWEMAVYEGENASKLNKAEFFGYGVDGGTGSFIDKNNIKSANAILKEKNGFLKFVDALEKNYKSTRNWALYDLEPNTAANIAMFSSGWGDGRYPTYFGYDTNNNVTIVVTDFFVFDVLKN